MYTCLYRTFHSTYTEHALDNSTEPATKHATIACIILLNHDSMRISTHTKITMYLYPKCCLGSTRRYHFILFSYLFFFYIFPFLLLILLSISCWGHYCHSSSVWAANNIWHFPSYRNDTCAWTPNKVFSQLGCPSEGGLGNFLGKWGATGNPEIQAIGSWARQV